VRVQLDPAGTGRGLRRRERHDPAEGDRLLPHADDTAVEVDVGQAQPEGFAAA